MRYQVLAHRRFNAQRHKAKQHNANEELPCAVVRLRPLSEYFVGGIVRLYRQERSIEIADK